MPRRQSVSLDPELCERLLSMHPNDATAELLDQGLSEAEARDVIMQLRQEASVTAELANTLLSLPPQEAVALLLEAPGVQEGGMTPEMAAELVQQLRVGFQSQYLTRELVEEILACGSKEEAVAMLLGRKDLELNDELAALLVLHVHQDFRTAAGWKCRRPCLRTAPGGSQCCPLALTDAGAQPEQRGSLRWPLQLAPGPPGMRAPLLLPAGVGPRPMWQRVLATVVVELADVLFPTRAGQDRPQSAPISRLRTQAIPHPRLCHHVRRHRHPRRHLRLQDLTLHHLSAVCTTASATTASAPSASTAISTATAISSTVSTTASAGACFSFAQSTSPAGSEASRRRRAPGRAGRAAAAAAAAVAVDVEAAEAVEAVEAVEAAEGVEEVEAAARDTRRSRRTRSRSCR